MNKLKQFYPLALIGQSYLGYEYLTRSDATTSDKIDMQSEESAEYYKNKAEEKRKRKAEKLKKQFKVKQR